ncbi:Hypothetical predicted protein [Olea europaea subsp. europaea]|uniref:Uncharacterized protein n=1 Tax=Olea europaea subsp. europaea TaxID=158383 RepID=A0A8S0VIA2_OLEEU|nr:Hypothetical predicted protein [Olea europaea subsp. europaea]
MEILPVKREKKHKKQSRKTENNEADATEILESENLCTPTVVDKQGFEKDEITEIEQEGGETVKKNNKAKKDAKGTKMEEEKSTNENELFRMCSEASV